MDRSEITDLDGLLKPLGGFGKFQIINMICICCVITLVTFSEVGYVLTAGVVKHRCLIAECEADGSSYTDEDKPWLTNAIPQSDDNTYASCLRYNVSHPSTSCGDFSESQFQCDDFVYETEEWTIGREDWGIHCDSDEYKLALIGSLYNAGEVIGGLYVGLLQDRYGRKLVILSLAVFVSVVGIIKSFSVNYIMHVCLEFLEATAAIALFNGPFILAVEIVDPSKRVLAGAIVSTAYPIAEMIIGMVQYLTFNWRNTLRICYAPFLLVTTFFWIIPESIRWLIDNGHTDEALVVLRKIAETNGTTLPEEAVNNILKKESEKAHHLEKSTALSRLKDLWDSDILRWRTVCSFTACVCIIFIYFAMTMHSTGISNDKFGDFILNGFVEIPGYAYVLFVLNRIGRKKTLVSVLLLCGLASIIDAFLPQDDAWAGARVALYLIGKAGAAGAVLASDVYTTELFPTSIRSTVMTAGLLCGKLATIVAPEITLLEGVYKPLPLLIFGCMSFIGIGAVLTFPETLGCPLPDTVLEAEDLGKKESPS